MSDLGIMVGSVMCKDAAVGGFDEKIPAGGMQCCVSASCFMQGLASVQVFNQTRQEGDFSVVKSRVLMQLLTSAHDEGNG